MKKIVLLFLFLWHWLGKITPSSVSPRPFLRGVTFQTAQSVIKDSNLSMMLETLLTTFSSVPNVTANNDWPPLRTPYEFNSCNPEHLEPCFSPSPIITVREWSRSVVTALCDPMDCSLPGSSVHGIFQAIVLEWVAISFSRGSSWSRDQTQVSRIVDRCVAVWATREEIITGCTQLDKNTYTNLSINAFATPHSQDNLNEIGLPLTKTSHQQCTFLQDI